MMRRAKRYDNFGWITGLVLTLLFFVIIMSTSTARAESEEERKQVTVGYYYCPGFLDGQSDEEQKSGLGYDYLQKISYYANWDYTYVYGTWSELFEKYMKGEIDVMCGVGYSKTRTKTLYYPRISMGTDTYYICKQPENRSITATYPRSFNYKKIGVVSNTVAAELLEKWATEESVHPEIVYFNGFSERDAAYLNGELDAIVLAQGTTGFEQQTATVVKLGEVETYFTVIRNRPDLLEELDTALSTMAESVADYYKTSSSADITDAESVKLNQKEKNWLGQHSKIVIGCFDGYAPYSFVDENGNISGIVKDIIPYILDELGLSAGVEIEYTGYSDYRKLIEDLNRGKLDSIFPMNKNLWKAENQKIYQTDDVISTSVVLTYKGEYGKETTDRIAVVKNNIMQYQAVKEIYPEAEIVYYDNINNCLNAIDDGKVGSTLLNGLRAIELVSGAGNQDLHSVELPNRASFCFGVSHNATGLLSILNRGISMIPENYCIERSYEYTRYVYHYSIRDFIRENPVMIISIAIGVVGVICIISVVYTCKVRKQSAELKRAKEMAERSNQAKTDFLFNMSHDIRTPMNAIIGYANLLKRNEYDEASREKYLDNIIVSGDHLLRLINNVLEMSRIESGKMVLEEEITDFEKLFNDIRVVFEEEYRSHNITVEREYDIIHKYGYLDKTKCNEIIINILSNAIKYTPEGGTIRVRITEAEAKKENYGAFCVEVTDTGIGMSDEFLPHIFENFTRERNSTESKVVGTGLGMGIVKKLVELMGGSIEVTSRLGVGTTVILHFNFRLTDTMPVELKEEVTLELPNVAGKRILLAEDNELNAEIATEILKGVGIMVEHAINGEVCVDMLKKAENGYYDLILMDVQMPVLNGYQATEVIRKLEDKEKATIPIIAMTANAFEEDRQNAIAVGMNGHVAKPISLGKLYETLISVLVSEDSK